MQNDQKKKKSGGSNLPIYGIGITWLVYSLSTGFDSPFSFVRCAAISVVVYFILNLITGGKKPAEQTAEEKSKAEPRPEPKPEPKAEPKPEPEKPKEQPKSTGDAELDKLLAQGREYKEQVARINDEIPDLKISAQLKQIEALVDLLLSAVASHPEKKKQLRQFMTYYLPTTVKLLWKYVELQNQEIRGDNIAEGMKRIEQLLDQVITAFKKQLDSLFEADVVDLTADIRVMEKMMAGEGLTGKTDFKE